MAFDRLAPPGHRTAEHFIRRNSLRHSRLGGSAIPAPADLRCRRRGARQPAAPGIHTGQPVSGDVLGVRNVRVPDGLWPGGHPLSYRGGGLDSRSMADRGGGQRRLVLPPHSRDDRQHDPANHGGSAERPRLGAGREGRTQERTPLRFQLDQEADLECLCVSRPRHRSHRSSASVAQQARSRRHRGA